MNSRLVIVFGLVVLLPHIAWGQLPQHDKYEHLGVQSCGASSCHGSAGVRNTYSVLQNEYITWARHDLHARAYKVLKNEQSQRIAANLGLEAAHTARICLDCHSDNVPPDRRGLQFQLSDGVACEACHGGAEHWLGVHISGGGNKHAETLAAGMYPTENPEARAELCLSCHLGTQDKFATHEIMGAGHPRLSFDLQKFTDIQPRHYRVDNDYRARKDYVEDTRAWAIGQVSASRQYLSLLQGPRMTGGGMFPELSLFDCHACHHAFKDYRWQANERSATPPGTVLLNDSSLAMSHIIASVVQPGTANSMLSAIRELHLASQKNVAALRAAAATLDRQLAQLADSLRETEFGRQQNSRMIEALSKAVADGRFSDYSDAEQATMALDVFSGVTGQYKDELDTLYEVVADVEVTDAKRFAPNLFAAVFNRSLSDSATRAPAQQVQRPHPVTPAPDKASQRPATTPKPVKPVEPTVTVAQTTTPRPDPVTQPVEKPELAREALTSTHVVNSDALRVRFKPEASAGVRGMLYFGHAVRLLTEAGEWSQVSYTDADGVIRTGWVASSLIVASSAAVSTPPPVRRAAPAPPASEPDSVSPTHVVDTGALKVRYQPDSSSAVRSIVYRGSEVQLLEDTGQWSQIAYFDSDRVARKGWVASRLIVDRSTAVSKPPVSTPPVSTPPVSTPPVSTPPVSTPPVSKPPVSTPPPAPPASEPGSVSPTHVVDTGALKVRYQPDSSSAVRSIVYRGAEVQLLENTGQWSQILYFDSEHVVRKGWVASRLIVERSTGVRAAPRVSSPPAVSAAPVAPAAPARQAPVTSAAIGPVVPTHVVNANALRVRFTPQSDAGVVGTLYLGDQVQVVDSSGEWSRVTYNEADGVIRRGWIASSYLDPI